MKLDEYKHVRNAIHANTSVFTQAGQWFPLHSVLLMANMARKTDAVTHLRGYHEGVIGMYPLHRVVAVGDREETITVWTDRYRRMSGYPENWVLTPDGFRSFTKLGVGMQALCTDFNKGVGGRYPVIMLHVTSVLLNNRIPFERDGDYIIAGDHKMLMTNIRNTDAVTINGVTTLGLSNYRDFLERTFNTKDLCTDEIVHMHSYTYPKYNFSVGVDMGAEALITRHGYILKATNEEI